MATDAVYSAELIDACLAELSSHLPAAWTTAGNQDCLALLECGDLRDYPAAENGIALDTPAIIIRPLTIGYDPEASGIGGRDGYANPFRLVHVRAWGDCYDDSGNPEDNMTRARIRYAKEINKALFADTYGRMGAPTLTCADSGGATVVSVAFERWDFAGVTEDVAEIANLNAQLWAIALDFSITIIAG